MSDLDLSTMDPSGALEEAAANVSRLSRGRFLGRALPIGVAVAGAGATTAAAASYPSRSRDTAILNYALTLEYIQSGFYTEAERINAIRGDAKRAARVVGGVERAHVQALRSVLGRKAVKRPFLNFRGSTEGQKSFLSTAVALEDLGAAAYKGQLGNIHSPAVLAAAVSIHSVEARHAAWIRYLAGAVPATSAFDDPTTMDETLKLVAGTRFLAAHPRMVHRNGQPKFTG